MTDAPMSKDDGQEVFFLRYHDCSSKRLMYIPRMGSLRLVDREESERLSRNPEQAPASVAESAYPAAVTGALKEPVTGIALTDACTLGCRYCYTAGPRPHRPPMAQGALRGIMHALIDEKLERGGFPLLRIAFFGGGEPTCDPEQFRQAATLIHEEAYRRGLAVSLSMTTNGCFTGLADFIRDNFAQVTLSIDGPEPLHDLHRPYPDGTGSFALVLDNARRLYESDLNVTFRATVSTATLAIWKEFVDFFAAEFPGCSLMVEPVAGFGRAKGGFSSPSEQAFEKEMYEAFVYSRGKIDLFTPATRNPARPSGHFCGASSGRSRIIASDCSIRAYPYPDTEGLFGLHYMEKTGAALKMPSPQTGNDPSKSMRSVSCRDCFCKYSCAGGCPAIRWSGAGILACNLTRNITENKLAEMYDEAHFGATPQTPQGNW